MSSGEPHGASKSQAIAMELVQFERLARLLETAKNDENFSTRDIMLLQAEIMCEVLSRMIIVDKRIEGIDLRIEKMEMVIHTLGLEVRTEILGVGEQLEQAISTYVPPTPPYQDQVSTRVDTGVIEHMLSLLLDHFGIHDRE